MTDEVERVLAELVTLAASARASLERGVVPDLTPLGHGIERLGRLSHTVDASKLAALRLKFVALTHELEQLAAATALSLSRTAAALEAAQNHQAATAAYDRMEKGG